MISLPDFVSKHAIAQISGYWPWEDETCCPKSNTASLIDKSSFGNSRYEIESTTNNINLHLNCSLFGNHLHSM